MDENPSLEHSKVAAVLRAGINIRPEFWDEFMQITGNVDGLSELLDVSKEKIAGWAEKIRSGLAEIDQADDEDAKTKKAEIMTTGDGEDIVNPNGHPDFTDDLRPTP